MNEDLFFLWFVNPYFSILWKLIFDFFVIHEICIYLHIICEPTTFVRIIFHFFGDLSIIKPRKLHQTRSKTWELTTVTENQEGLESSLPQCVIHTILMHENGGFCRKGELMSVSRLCPAFTEMQYHISW